MPDLEYSKLFRALFFAGCLGYMSAGIWNVWVGIFVLAAGGWLFYDFWIKMVVLLKFFLICLPVAVKELAEEIWIHTECKITFILWCVIISFPLIVIKNSLDILELISWFIFWTIVFAAFHDFGVKINDKDQWESIKNIHKFLWKLFVLILWTCPKFILWSLPKFIAKVIILTVYKVHSKELVAVSFYALSGMFYIVLFSPFNLAPQILFLMAIGCGIFTGSFGCLAHKLLSVTFAQGIYIKVKAW